MARAAMALALAVAVCCGGCAYTFNDGLTADYQRSDPPRCDTGRGWVAVDVLSALWGAIVVVDATVEFSEDPPPAIVGVLFGAIGVANVLSARWGYRAAGECREALRDHAAWRAERARAPGGADVPIGPAPTPIADAISPALAVVQAAIEACARDAGISGRVTVRVRLARNGHAALQHVPRGDDAFRTCVGAAIESLKIGPIAKPTAISIPFDVAPPPGGAAGADEPGP